MWGTYLENFMSRPNVIPAFQLTPLHKQGQELRSGQTVTHYMSRVSLLVFCAFTIRKHLWKVDFERSGRGQEPSRGHKFSILENIVFHRDFTSATLPSFDVILLGRACPKPCSDFAPLVRKNGVSCLHSFTEKLARRQEVQ